MLENIEKITKPIFSIILGTDKLCVAKNWFNKVKSSDSSMAPPWTNWFKIRSAIRRRSFVALFEIILEILLNWWKITTPYEITHEFSRNRRTLTGDIGSDGHTVTAGNGIDLSVAGGECMMSVGFSKKLLDIRWIRIPANAKNINGTNIQTPLDLDK